MFVVALVLSVSLDGGAATAQERCELDEAVACIEWAHELELADADPRVAYGRARLAGAAGCERLDERSCEAEFEASEVLAPVSAIQRAREVGRRCTRGETWACGALAHALWFGDGVVGDRGEALRLGAELCRTSLERRGCLVVALGAMAEGRWVEAAEPARVACLGFLAEGCTIEGQLTRSGRGGDEDEPRGEARLARGCRLGSAEACGRLVTTKTIPEVQRRALMDRGCQLGSVAACAQRLELEPPLEGAPLERALRVRCETGSDPHGCTRLGRLLLEGPDEAGRHARGTTLLDQACRQGALEACEAVRAADSLDVRRHALNRLCLVDSRSACAALLQSLSTASLRERASLWQTWVSACRVGLEESCKVLVPLLPSLRSFERRGVFEGLTPSCRAGHVEACRTVDVYGTARREDTRFAIAVLCRADELSACHRFAEQNERALHTATVWARAHACRLGERAACDEVHRLTKPDFLALRTLFARGGKLSEEARDWFEASVFARRFELGKPLPVAVPPFIEGRAEPSWTTETGAALGAWLQTVGGNGRAFIREAKLCQRLTNEGVPHASLELEAAVMLADPTLRLEGQRAGSTTATYEVCDERWRALRSDGSTFVEGLLWPLPDYERFAPIEVLALTPQTEASATRWPVTGAFALGVELGAGVPASGQRFLADTASLRVLAALLPDATFEWGVRVGFNLPTGPKNPFAAQFGLGTVVGVFTSRPVQWRALAGWVDLWALFEPFGFAVVPSLSTQLAVALGKQELMVELGARLSFPVSWADRTLLPRPLLPTPFVGVTFRPTF